MDSTIITIECIDELADFAGIKPQIAAVTRRAMNGELDFAAALRERVALLAGLPSAADRRRHPRAAGASCRVRRHWCGRCGRQAPAPPWCPAASPPSPARASSVRLRPRGGQRARDRGRAADRTPRRRVARCAGQARGPAAVAPGAGHRRPADHGRGRRRQRSADAAGRRPGRRLSRPSSASARPRPPGSTMATSPPCSSCRATAATSSSAADRLFLEAERHEAQVALAVDQQQDRLLALLLAPG